MDSISTIIIRGATFAQLRNLDSEVIETIDAVHPLSEDRAVEFKREGEVPGITVTIHQVASYIGQISFEVAGFQLYVYTSNQSKILAASRLGGSIRLQRSQQTGLNALSWRIVCA